MWLLCFRFRALFAVDGVNALWTETKSRREEDITKRVSWQLHEHTFCQKFYFYFMRISISEVNEFTWNFQAQSQTGSVWYLMIRGERFKPLVLDEHDLGQTAIFI